MTRVRIAFLCAGLIAVALLSMQDRADTKTQAAIYGAVVDASHGKPVAGVSVTVFVLNAEKPLASTFTDAAGKYSFEGLKGGAYRLAFHKPGYEDVQMAVIKVAPNDRVILAGALALGPGRVGLIDVHLTPGDPHCGSLVQPGVTADVYVVCAGGR